MYLTIFDLVLILLLFLFIAFGFALGLIQALGALIGAVLGTWLAGLYYLPFADWLTPLMFGHANTAKVVAFILIFVLVNRLTGLAFWIIGKIFNLISIIPFTKTINRVLGALFGFVEGTLVLGLSLYFILQIPFSDWFSGVIIGSKVAFWLMQMGAVLAPLLPALLRHAQSFL
ncbi:MAG: CvpA family protein [Candidatus Buchananbacteria bacterium]|nr:CvpA family protein [Candidatus Buchananbacteria bacterium]